jgi:hypothetical protein
MGVISCRMQGPMADVLGGGAEPLPARVTHISRSIAMDCPAFWRVFDLCTDLDEAFGRERNWRKRQMRL